MKKTVFTLISLFILTSIMFAQHGPQSTYRFLNIPVSAKAASLGGSPVSLLYSDPSQMHVNPAFLSPSSSSELAVSYVSFLSEVDMAFASTAYQLEEIGTLGIGLRYFNYGQFDRIDAAGNNDGQFNASDMALKMALSRKYLDFLRYGLGVDIIYSSYETFKSTGVAFSGGLLLDFAEQDMSIGFSFVNAGKQLSTYNGVEESLPFDLRLGVSRKLLYLPLRVTATAHSLHRWEMTTPNDIEPPNIFTNFFRHLAIGGEFLFSDNFHFRLGYNQYLHDELKTDQRIDFAGFGLGVAIKVKSISIDFSRNSYSEMGQMFQFGLSTKF